MIKIFKFIPTEKDPKIKRRRKYLAFAYPFVITTILYFLYVFNFQYHASQANSFMIPVSIIILLSPLIYFVTRNYYLFASIFFITVVTYVYTLIYMAGGINAPGLFWVVATPIFAATILGRRGAIISAFLVFFILALFYFLDIYGISYGTPFLFDLKIERLRNIIIFSLFFISIFIYYLQNEERNDQIVNMQKDKIDNLLRLIIHDFSGPLSTIAMCSNKLGKISSMSDCADIYKTNLIIGKNVENLVEMIDQMRSMKALKDGKYNIETKLVYLGSMIDELIENYSNRIIDKNINIIVKKSAPIKFETSPAIFKNQILGNIISNAIKFSLEGGDILIECSDNNEFIEIRVTDYGIGIPTDVLNNIYKLNAKTSRPGTLGEAGTGYGMPLVKDFVSALGGKIEIVTREIQQYSVDHGTTVILQFKKA